MSVTTNYALVLSGSSLLLMGTLDDLHSEASLTVSFEWGDTIACVNETTPEVKSSIGEFEASLDTSTLDSFHTTGTIYFFKAKATDGITTWNGRVRRFVCLLIHGDDPYVIDNEMSTGTLTDTDIYDNMLVLDWIQGNPENPTFAGVSISGGILTPVMESPEFAGVSISGGTIV